MPMKKITLTTDASPEWLAEICHGEDCPCRGAFECPFDEERGPACDIVTPEMWARLMEVCDGNTASEAE